LKLRAKRGRNQQGLCFVSTDTSNLSTTTCELVYNSNSVFSDIRDSTKVPKGTIVLDARIYDMLHCSDEDEISVIGVADKIPTCTEIHLDIVSKRGLQNHAVVQAVSQRIDDFQEHFEGLILKTRQEFMISDLGISFMVRFLSPTDSVTRAARISWKNLLKIHLGALESQSSNLCIIVEVAAATQVADVRSNVDIEDDSYISRHEAILHCLEAIEMKFSGYSNDAQFAGIVFSDKVLPFITFNSYTGEEAETTSLHSSSLIGAYRKWVNTTLGEFSNSPSNPGIALERGLEIAHMLSGAQGLPTAIIFFSSGFYSAGQNPVKVTRKNLGDRAIRILCISVGEDSATDIMDAIAKEGNGLSIHMSTTDKMDLVVDAINDMISSKG